MLSFSYSFAKFESSVRFVLGNWILSKTPGTFANEKLLPLSTDRTIDIRFCSWNHEPFGPLANYEKHSLP